MQIYSIPVCVCARTQLHMCVGMHLCVCCVRAHACVYGGGGGGGGGGQE